MTKTRSIGFIAAALLAGGATTAFCFSDALGLAAANPMQDGQAIAAPPSDATDRPLDALGNAPAWLTPVAGGPQALRGKVVVINFWTYSCINSLRALPYLRAWDARYGAKGLVVVGVHAPEFGFERDAAKVRLAMGTLGVRYANVQDNSYAIWNRFGNEGWPGFYFIDAKGQVRGYRIGEGHYDEAEQFIRKLLSEAGHDVNGIRPAPVPATGVEAQADWGQLRSPEAYIGYAKAEGFLSPGGLVRDASHSYDAAASIPLNRWDMTGRWTVGREFATLDGAAGAIRYRFHARDAHIVLGGARDGRPIRFRVTIDGAAPGAHHGVDVDAAGWGAVKADRLYQIVRQTGEVAHHTLKIEFARPGVRAYVFTFG